MAASLVLYATEVLIRVKNLRPGTPLLSSKRASAIPGGVIFLRIFYIILRHPLYKRVIFPLLWSLGEEGRWREVRGGRGRGGGEL